MIRPTADQRSLMRRISAMSSVQLLNPYDVATWTAVPDSTSTMSSPYQGVALGCQLVDNEPPAELPKDLTHPQLIAVTDNVNQSKGDQDTSTWQPSLSSRRCAYNTMWITVKCSWGNCTARSG